MNDLRDRIAHLLYEDGQRPMATAARLAETVIRELGMTAEYSYGTTYPNVPVTDVRYIRWATKWTADEGTPTA